MSASYEEQVPSIWDYARFHNVIGNYTSRDPLSYLATLSHREVTDSLANDYALPSLDFNDTFLFVQSDLKEKIVATRKSAALLTSVLKAGSSGRENDLKELGDRHRFRDIKLEKPLLMTDHEVDVQTFVNSSELDRVDLDMPCEDVNEENDEGLTYPESFWAIADEVRASSFKEKMHCTREVLVRLKDARNWCSNPVEASVLSSRFMNEEISFSKRRKRRIIGSAVQPLMPRESTPQPFMPPSPALHMPLAQEPETPVNSGQEFVKKLLNDGYPFPTNGGEPVLEQIPRDLRVRDFLFEEDDNSSFLKQKGRNMLPPPSRKRIGLRVEPPMTPPLTVKKRRNRQWSNPIEDLIKEDKISSAPELDLAISSNPFESPYRELTEITQVAAKNIEGRLIAETFQGLDADLRCNVPHLDSLEIIPPWVSVAGQILNDERLQSFLIEIQSTASLPTLQAPTKHEQRTLDWEPLRDPAVITVDERPEDTNNNMADCLLDAEEDGLLIYSNLLHKSNIHRLKSVWSSMEIDGFLPETNRKENPSCSNESHIVEPHSRHDTMGPKDCSKKRKRRDSLRSRKKIAKASAIGKDLTAPQTDLFILPPQFSAMNALDNFLSVRQKNICPERRPEADSSSLCGKQEPMSNAGQQLPAPASCPVELPEPSPLVPNFPEPPGQMTMILSNVLLKSHRSLVFELEKHLPSLNLLFRDYEDLELGLAPCKNSDADVIVSPKTGVILATSQATTQQYLPGQAPNLSPSFKNAKSINSPLRVRVAESSLQYEELYVLLSHKPAPVSTSATHDTRSINAIDDKTASSLASFSMFCASLAPYSAVIPVIISPSPANVLSNWLVALARKHYIPMTIDPSLATLQADPSAWEIFLRKAGFNPFAALYILSGSQKLLQNSMLDAAGSQRPPAASDSLSAFITMPSLERRMLFSPAIGGKVLRRAESTLEAVW